MILMAVKHCIQKNLSQDEHFGLNKFFVNATNFA